MQQPLDVRASTESKSKRARLSLPGEGEGMTASSLVRLLWVGRREHRPSMVHTIERVMAELQDLSSLPLAVELEGMKTDYTFSENDLRRVCER